MKVGFIGLGNVGGKLAESLIRNKFDLTIRDLDKKLTELLLDIPNVTYEIDYMAKPNSSPFETELTEAIKKSQALSVLRDDIQWIPSVSNGFTDSRFT